MKVGSDTAPILIVVGGLPATGKSTVAGAMVRRTGFAFVRVDRIEQAIIDSAELRPPLGLVGYTVAYGVAADPAADAVTAILGAAGELAGPCSG